jgi:hypothetical protein
MLLHGRGLCNPGAFLIANARKELMKLLTQIGLVLCLDHAGIARQIQFGLVVLLESVHHLRLRAGQCGLCLYYGQIVVHAGGKAVAAVLQLFA